MFPVLDVSFLKQMLSCFALQSCESGVSGKEMPRLLLCWKVESVATEQKKHQLDKAPYSVAVGYCS